MNRLTDMIPTTLIRTTVAMLAFTVLVATVTATLLSPSGAHAAATAPQRQALAPQPCSALEARSSKASAKETKRKSRSKKRANGKKKAAASQLRGVLNINNASAKELSLLPGVGPAKADRVVDYRKRHGNFKRVKDLRRVKGFGYKSLKKLEKWLTVKGATTLEVAKK